ncbi:sigma-54 interaction domain-containing protein [Sphingomonas sp. CFBP9019]|uniref:sigma-54 interaction domain-containing protein n=1 Tax=Sphingomonas sp. CFBP9019 TaxID=3096532 RepID=UPI002A6B4AC9|nr:sigma 54-interacting transcriptional regulator [Sphingomonas sp. CFBP9019]MDY1010334.1 sigma 54-interacting transcriptional regulator [Sphingomonas sp. CFBP9019]
MSWIGLADLAAFREGLFDGAGPIGAALTAQKFDRALLLANHSPGDVDNYATWLRGRAPHVHITTHLVPLSGPSAFAEIFAGVARVLDDHIAELREALDVALYLSPGTPVMAATWLILGKTRYHQLAISFLESSQRTVSRLDVPFDLAATILPDVLRTADERIARHARGVVPHDAAFDAILHRSEPMRHVVNLARKAARSTLPVLIEGESGVGKELLAQAIHKASPFATAPLVTVNCGAIPEHLVESLLFGHRRGAFTGATTDHVGYLEAAAGGTLFLDEIGELPLTVQVKLLRALQEGEVMPVGATRAKQVKFRIVAATNRELHDEVTAERFREDLFYRLCVIRLTVPPLRERGDDLSFLVDKLLARMNAETETMAPPRLLSEDARALLLAQRWSGNVRELQNTLLRLLFLTDAAIITAEHVRSALLPTPMPADISILNRPLGGAFDLKQVQAELTCHYIERALDQARGGISQAARLLGTSRQNLSNWMKETGADEPLP